jgi:perosamine synthetase
MSDTEFQKNVENILSRLKSQTQPFYISYKGQNMGFLQPVGKHDIENPDIIRLLAMWRDEHMDSFPTQFKVTEDGTKKWLKEQVIERPDRILFMVYNSDDVPIGHMGLSSFDYHHRFCEIDNVVRGVPHSKGIMTHALSTLIKFSFDTLKLNFLNLRVFEDKMRAISLYKRCGFSEVKGIPMECITDGENKKFIEIPAGCEKPADRYFVLMNLQRPHGNSPRQILTSGPSISHKEISYVSDAVRNGWNLSWSKYINEFENRFAEYVGTKYAISTSSGTGAIHLSLLAMGIKEGDEAILPDLCWVAAPSAVTYCRARPVFADIDEKTWCLDPKSVEERITDATKVIIPVHTYGYPCDMGSINKIAKENGIFVLEDAAPSAGSMYKGRKTGSLGDIAAFSFQGAKILVTGEGGMIVTDNKEFYERAKFLGDHGRDPKITFWINEIGYKYKMSNIQAALGLAQLERNDGFVEKKRKIFDWYFSRLHDIDGIDFVEEKDGVKTNHWMISVVLSGFPGKRDYLMSKLKEHDIDTRPFFHPNTKFSFFAKYSNPISYYISENGINLPSSVNLTEDDIDFVSDKIRKALMSIT